MSSPAEPPMKYRTLVLLNIALALGRPTPVPAAEASYRAIFDAPPAGVPTAGMPDGPLLGNGDVGVAMAGPPEAQRFHLGKNDFWTRTPGDAKVITLGTVELLIPALRGASYHQEQDLGTAEVVGSFVKGDSTVLTRSWVDAAANLLFTEVSCKGAPVTLSARLTPGEAGTAPPTKVAETGTLNVGREQYGGGRWYFDGDLANVLVTNAVLNGRPEGQPTNPEHFDGKTTWREMAVGRFDQTVSVAAWIRIASASPDANYIVSKGEWNRAYSLGLSAGRLRWAINGTFCQTEQPLAKGKWLYVVGTFDGKRMRLYVDGALCARLGGAEASADGWFTRKADDLSGRGREVAVATRILGWDSLDATLKPGETATVATAILSDLDTPDFFVAAKKKVAGLTTEEIVGLAMRHREWWGDFWARSAVEIPDKEIEKRWYAALYALGSCSRPGKVAPGLWGNWLTTEHPNWHGDFHLNYNFQAPFYLAYSANHAELSLPFYQAVGESVENGRAMAKRHGWQGVHFPVCIGPWGLSPENPDGDWGQRSNAAYAALNFIWYWQYTQDGEFLRQTAYPYLREVAAFWEDYLKLENGRYVIHNDSIHEGSGPDFNPLLSLGLVRTLFVNMLAMSRELGVDEDRRGKWQDILERLSGFPVQERNGRTVFRYSEKGMAWNDSNTLGIQHIFPAGAIGLDSDPKLLAISRNMIDAMQRWSDGNGFSSWYTACARVGYDPKRILAGLRRECDTRSAPNLLLQYGGGGLENCSGFLAVNEMLLQSHDGVIRLFPCWPRELDARFRTLRAVGAFLVSAELKSGSVALARIDSEQGRDCTFLNPWPGRKVWVLRNTTSAETLVGDRFTLKTAANEVLQFVPID